MEHVVERWWRVALVVAGVALGAFPWGAPPVGLFGVLPIVVWCWGLARSPRTGLAVGLALLALLAWFVLPRGLGWSGRWVPSAVEVYWLLPVFAAVLCAIGVLVERRRLAGLGRLAAMVLAGLVATGFVLFAQLEAPPGDEGVLPGPPGLRVAEGTGWCGSGNCARELDATGDRAHELVRAHLAARGFAPRPSLSSGDERVCRLTGLVAAHEVCAELRDVAVDTVRVLWYVN
nr:hypothetical protein [Goodfellowiella coeruleoviolacea]